MLSCQEMTRLVTDYVERRLMFLDRIRFQLHLGMCGHCRRYLRQMRIAAAMMGRAPPEPVPEATMQELLARFRGWRA
jgi:predicted anti-sigma-YlaC factor YlaD